MWLDRRRYRMRLWILPLCGLMALCGCQREPAAQPVPPAGPETAVRKLARHLQDSDLESYARAMVPPAEYARLELAWREGGSRWPLTELPLDDQLAPLLATLAAPGAEAKLQQGFQRNFANQNRDLKEAARSLGLFGVQYVKREGVYSAEERAHYAQVIAALGEWAQQAPLGDPKRSAAAIAKLAAAARKTGLAGEPALQSAGMTGSLRRLSPFFAEFKSALAGYGLPLDRSTAGLRTTLLEQRGDRARVGVRYPLGNREIETTVSLRRRDGRWYLADSLRHAQDALGAQALAMPDAQASAR